MRASFVRLLPTVGLAACAAAPIPGPPPTTGPAPAAPPVAAPAAPTLRLPTDARPLRADLELWLDPESPSFRGRVAFDLDVVRPTRALWLNATDLTVEGAVFSAAGGAARTARVLAQRSDFVGFAFDEELAAARGRLTVTFHGAIDRERSRAIYSAKEAGGDAYLYTFFEPIDARRAFPSFDEPGYKIPWQLTLHVPARDVALANAGVVAEVAEAGETKAVSFAESKPMPSYLVAFVVGPFEVVDAGQAGHHGTPLRFVVPRGRASELAYARSVTPKIVGLLEDYFGIPYPYEKLDVAVVPRYWGTMEHPGLVALGQPLTLIAPSERSLSREREYANIAIHELGHYWFGDYVTTAWWDDTWLNEALTTWIDAKISHELEPAWRFDLQRVARASWAMSSDALESSKKIRQPVLSVSDIESSFDGDITYYKGQGVFAMFEAWMTPETTRRAVRSYLEAHAWHSATSEDLFAAFDAAKPGAGAALKTFVEQPGLPLVAVAPLCEGGKATLTITQRRYRVVGSTASEETWSVPVCVRYGAARADVRRACTLLTTPSATVPVDVCPTWVDPNADGLGYYHATRAHAGMAAAFGRGNDGERLALLRDATALVKSGDLKLGDAMDLVKASAASDVALVFVAGANLARFAMSRASGANAARFERFLARTYGPVARNLGLRPRAGERAAAIEIRRVAIGLAAFVGDDAGLRAEAHKAAHAWLKEDAAIDPELRVAILSAAGRTGDRPLFDALVTKAKHESDKARLVAMLSALGAFATPDLEERARALLGDAALDLRDAIELLYVQLSAPATRVRAWSFVRDHFDELAARMRSDEVGFVLSAIQLCDDEHRRELESLAPRIAAIHGPERELAKAIERTARCASESAANQASLEAFLARL